MGWFNKKPDPISSRARALNDQIAQLEAEIKRLDQQLQDAPAAPKVRSTALPGAATPANANPRRSNLGNAGLEDPIFEPVNQDLLNGRLDHEASRAHFNELGVRKYDLPALWQRIRNQFRGPATTNPKLVSYLAAGGMQGLRPLRYEKRVARNRFIALAAILFLVLLGLAWALVRASR